MRPGSGENVPRSWSPVPPSGLLQFQDRPARGWKPVLPGSPKANASQLHITYRMLPHRPMRGQTVILSLGLVTGTKARESKRFKIPSSAKLKGTCLVENSPN